MKGMFVKDMEIMRGNMKTFIGVYIIAIFCFLSTSAGHFFSNQLCVCSGCCYGTEYHSK